MRFDAGARLAALSLLVAGAVVGCTPAAPAPGLVPPPPLTSSAPAVATPPAAPQPTPDRARDRAALGKALVTAKDLGSPWRQQKKVAGVGGAGEACPGVPSVAKSVPPLASAEAQLLEGSRRGASVLLVSLMSYPDAEAAAAYGAGLTAVQKKCRAYRDATKLYVVLQAAPAPSVAGADQTWAYIERVYYDKAHRRLAYARHYVTTRTGRLLTSTQYAFLVPTSDPGAEDFRRVTGLAGRQLSKAARYLDS